MTRCYSLVVSVLLLLSGCVGSHDHRANTEHRLRIQNHLEELTDEVRHEMGRLDARIHMNEQAFRDVQDLDRKIEDLAARLKINWAEEATACDGAAQGRWGVSPCPCPSHKQ